jgi:hypothetical protein
MYRTLGLCFFSLVLGTLIGGALIALLPHPNIIHLTVMPYQGVNISPQKGDTVEWAAYGQKTPPIITFSPFTGSPCRDKNPSSTCVYDEAGDGIYTYSCSGSATCDPGMGPGSGTRGGNGAILIPVLREIAQLLQKITITIDRVLGFIATDQTPTTAPPAAGPAAAVTATPSTALTPVEPALRLLDGNPDGLVGCIDNQTRVSNTSITKTVGQQISWAGSTPFSIAVDPSICQGNMSTPAYVQSCMVTKPAPATTYTITNVACTKQPILNTPTITANPAIPASR